ncbi:MAG: aldehyde dehydrogenase family protein [Fimbriimonadia bacterium]|jgi:acyl-CoA reductase-like NAD-dependent aldehyde dehydrogenase
MISQLSSFLPAIGPNEVATLAVRAPYDGSSLAETQILTGDGTFRALGLAVSAGRRKPPEPPIYERARILREVAARIEQERDDLALLIAREGGKPLRDALVEVSRAALSTRLAAEEALRLHGEEIPMTASAAAEGRMAFTIREPIGVVLAISAFNHPLNLIAHQVAPAVAVGCPVLVKPDLRTPLSCLRYVRMLHDAGLPPEWALPIPCENDVAEQIASSPEIAFLSFIGSAKVGWYLRSKLAPGVRCALEHGGAAPVIVDETAGLDLVVPALLKGGFYHAGQVCVSVQRVFVHRAVFEEAVARLAAGAEALNVGDPADPNTDVGPLILKREVDRVHEWVTEAIAAGARLAAGGHAVGAQCYAPTVLANPPLDSRVMTEEVFGPVICVVEYDDMNEAVEMANSVRWKFQAAVFTRDIGSALRAARGLDASAVMVNDHTAFRVDWMPFGGRAESGLGIGGIRYSMRDLTQEKLIVLRET